MLKPPKLILIKLLLAELLTVVIKLIIKTRGCNFKYLFIFKLHFKWGNMDLHLFKGTFSNL